MLHVLSVREVIRQVCDGLSHPTKEEIGSKNERIR